jgi:ATP-dependent exoDNAse (exonuclease V) beta subunit
MDFTILHELAKFNHIIYHDAPHLYYINDVNKISATTFIGKFKPKFETEKIATEYSDSRGLDKQSVLDEWEWKRDFSTIKGSLFHKYAEDYLSNKIFPYDAQYYQKLFGVDILKPKFDKLVKMFHQYYNDSKENLIPIKSEWIVGDEELGICGCVDQLYYNKKSGMLEIWDWKTNKAIRTKSDYNNRYKHPIEHLEECEMNTYSLQLSLYKYIIEKNTNLKLGSCYIVWFFEGNESYKIFKTSNFREEIESMIGYAKQYKWI